jgi:acyl-CoA hydrolase
MVAVDDDRKPAPVTPLRPFTPEEKRRFEQAQVGRALCQALEQRSQGMRLLPH